MGKFKTGCLGFIGIIIILGLIGSCMNGSSDKSSSATQETAKPQVVYTSVDINTLLSEAKENAAAANQKYKNKDLKITGGILGDIESDGDYISINNGERFSLMHIQAFTRGDKALKNQIMSLKKGQNITIDCHVEEVGESLGYRVILKGIE